MLTAERNQRLTQTGPTTSGGALLRRFWQPVALAEELDGPRPVRPVRLLGEDLVLFRDPAGRIALLDRHCAHRGADLAFGRAEDGGLRCPFHGWLFDTTGACLEQPAEPEGSNFHCHVRQKSYPCVLRSGIVFAWLGAGAPPAFPEFDCFIAPESHVFAFKGKMECNWLQALEVGIDPAHASFLHRFFADEDTQAAYGRQFRDATLGADLPMTQLLRDYPRPRIEVERTPYGLRLAALRDLVNTGDGSETHIRITNLVFPQAFVIPLSREMTITQWHVPVDDMHCYWYAIFTSFAAPVDKAQMRSQRLALYSLPDYVPRVGRHNDYGYNEQEQLQRTYTGMGEDINVHDQWAVESMGAIQDRTREHLGQTDRAIAAYRRMLLAAMDANDAGQASNIPMLNVTSEQATTLRGPPSIDAIGPRIGWQEFWQARDAERRSATPWAAGLRAA